MLPEYLGPRLQNRTQNSVLTFIAQASLSHRTHTQRTWSQFHLAYMFLHV